MCTTHHGRLKSLKYGDRRFENACVEFDDASLRPTYRLLWGVPGRSNALAIASRLGMPSDVIDGAREKEAAWAKVKEHHYMDDKFANMAVCYNARLDDTCDAAVGDEAVQRQLRLSKPVTPPWRWFGPLFVASVYSLPSSENLPLAMRLATRPATHPKYGDWPLWYGVAQVKPSVTSPAFPALSGARSDVIVAPSVTTCTAMPSPPCESVYRPTISPSGITPKTSPGPYTVAQRRLITRVEEIIDRPPKMRSR